MVFIAFFERLYTCDPNLKEFLKNRITENFGEGVKAVVGGGCTVEIVTCPYIYIYISLCLRSWCTTISIQNWVRDTEKRISPSRENIKECRKLDEKWGKC